MSFFLQWGILLGNENLVISREIDNRADFVNKGESLYMAGKFSGRVSIPPVTSSQAASAMRGMASSTHGKQK